MHASANHARPNLELLTRPARWTPTTQAPWWAGRWAPRPGSCCSRGRVYCRCWERDGRQVRPGTSFLLPSPFLLFLLLFPTRKTSSLVCAAGMTALYRPAPPCAAGASYGPSPDALPEAALSRPGSTGGGVQAPNSPARRLDSARDAEGRLWRITQG